MTFGELAALGVGSMSYLAMSAQWNTEIARLSRHTTTSRALPLRTLKVWAPAVMEEDVSMSENSKTVVYDDEGGHIIERERIVFRNPWSPGRFSTPALDEIGPLDSDPLLSCI